MEQTRIRFWQGLCAGLALALVGMAIGSTRSVVAQGQKPRFTEIDVERINVLEADGTVKLVIANRQRAPDQVSEGQSRPRAANNKSPGITFFDDAGDEAGGLKISGDRRGGPAAGMTVWDRPDVPLPEVVRRYERLQALPAGAERSKLEAEFEACCAGFGATRIFVGKNRGRDAVLALSDARGRERLKLIVTASGDARIEFLDNSGKPTTVLPAQR